jgi:uncharacterized repeat protein (TIGR03803 family)
MTHRQCPLTFGGTLFLALLTFARYAGAQTLTTLYSFTGSTNGSNPASVVIGSVPGGHLALYGTTTDGGASKNGNGTVFSLTPPASSGGSWTQAVLQRFNYSDGSGPQGVLIGNGGVLYGTTYIGGAFTSGTVFSLTPPTSPGDSWTEAVLYNFTGGSDGSLPAGLVAGAGGVLYGTTAYGGASNAGTVFSLTPPVSPGGAWTETVLYSFTGGANGAIPGASIVIGPDGGLYGMTSYFAGDSNCGTVFALHPPASPGGAWVERVVHTFTCAPNDGDNTSGGGLVKGADGVLYGTTAAGGASNGGTVFSLAPPTSTGGTWTEAVLYSFPFPSGFQGNYYYGPVGSVVIHGGVLYGVTNDGGSGSGPYCTVGTCGMAFSLTPPTSPGGAWTEAVLHNFTGDPRDGANPSAGLVMSTDGMLYGTTVFGGSANVGTVFAVKP